MHFFSPLRYPGGKAFLASEFEQIIKIIGQNKPTYIEPYAGGAGAALSLLFSNKVRRIIINDLDKAIYAFWKSVTDYSGRFAEKIFITPVTISEWERQRKIYLNKDADIFNRGFATFFLNRTNRSGVMNAWPIGGKNQDGLYRINARYNKKKLAERVIEIGKYRKRIKVLNEDGIKLAKKYLGQKNTFIYLDPPYFKKGAMLYFNHYEDTDHKKLADLLNSNANHHWVLTYDEVAKIRSLYSERARKRLSLKYRVYNSYKTREARELMFFSDSLSVVKSIL